MPTDVNPQVDNTNPAQGISPQQDDQNQFANMTNEQIIDLFLEDILLSIGLNEAPDSDKIEFKTKLKEELEARVGVVVMNAIPEDKSQEFVEIMKNNPTQEQINGFISANVANLENIVVEAMKEFKEEFLKEFDKNLQTQSEEDKTNEGSIEENTEDNQENAI